MSSLKKEVLQMLYALPENSLLSIKPLLSELLTNAVLLKDPSANVSEMDEFDKSLFLQALREPDTEYVTFEEALSECGVNVDEL